MAKRKKTAGEGEGVSPDSRSPKSANLLRRAVREAWPVTAEIKASAVAAARLIVANDDADIRARVAAMKFLAEADKINQTDHWNDDKNKRLDDGKATERVDGVVLKVAGLEAKD